MNTKTITTDLIIPRMTELGMSRYRLSKLSGVPESTLSRWFSGKTDIHLDTFLKVAKVLGIDIL